MMILAKLIDEAVIAKEGATAIARRVASSPPPLLFDEAALVLGTVSTLNGAYSAAHVMRSSGAAALRDDGYVRTSNAA